MTDRDLVLRKLSVLRDHVERVRRRRTGEPETFLGDVDLQDAAAMSVLVAIQEAIDIALHLSSDEGWGVPGAYAEAFELLARNEVLGDDLALELRRITALRNRLAHGYASVDPARLWSEIPAGLDALDRFAAAVAGWLGPAEAH